MRGQYRRKNLDRHCPIETNLLSPVDGTHTALAKNLAKLEITPASTNQGAKPGHREAQSQGYRRRNACDTWPKWNDFSRCVYSWIMMVCSSGRFDRGEGRGGQPFNTIRIFLTTSQQNASAQLHIQSA